MPSFFDLQKFAATGIASADMTHFDKARALAAFGGGKTQTMTGVPPLTFKANGTPLISWSMLGNGQQTGAPTFCGVRTANLVDPFALSPGYLNTSGSVSAHDGTRLEFTSDFIPVSSNDYTWSLSEDWGDRAGWVARVFYDSGKGMIGSRLGGIVETKSGTFSVPSGASYVRIAWRSYGTIALSLSSGVNELPYEPYGYKIPITCAGQTTPIYIGDPLRKALDGSDAIDVLSSAGTITREVDAEGNALATPTTQAVDVPEIPTAKGQNTLTVDTDLQPSEMTIKYRE